MSPGTTCGGTRSPARPDDPGPVVVKVVLENAGVYSELAGEPVQDPTFDVTVVHPTPTPSSRLATSS
jgi:hypothetical protein